jgi:FdhD protein
MTSSFRESGPSATPVAIARYEGDRLVTAEDLVAVEEPLEIRLVGTLEGRPFQKSLSITMRTPGHDRELAAGFLFTEGLIRHPSDLVSLAPCGPVTSSHGARNVIKAELAPHVTFDPIRLERHFYTTSSCGVCGKSSLEALRTVTTGTRIPDGPPVPADLIRRLPEMARAAQEVFEQTGGLHAAAWIDPSGQLLDLREDVGRHNALDKLIGARFLEGTPSLGAGLVLVSGRASFELVQKAVMAGVPLLAAVGAPSSLAIELASESGMTLVGFVRPHRFNVYSGLDRIAPLAGSRGKDR